MTGMNPWPIRGEDTTRGQAGYCPRCERSMPTGPDACLGVLPGVSHACCGHGVTRRAYVVLGGEPGQDVDEMKRLGLHPEVLRGKLALRYFGMTE